MLGLPKTRLQRCWAVLVDQEGQEVQEDPEPPARTHSQHSWAQEQAELAREAPEAKETRLQGDKTHSAAKTHSQH